MKKVHKKCSKHMTKNIFLCNKHFLVVTTTFMYLSILLCMFSNIAAIGHNSHNFVIFHYSIFVFCNKSSLPVCADVCCQPGMFVFVPTIIIQYRQLMSSFQANHKRNQTTPLVHVWIYFLLVGGGMSFMDNLFNFP